MKKIINMLTPVAITSSICVIALYVFTNIIDKKIQNIYEEKKDSISVITESGVKDKGSTWIDVATKSDELVVMGSSEFSSEVSQNIKYEFPNDGYKGGFLGLGHASVQNGLHAMNLGANSEAFQGNNIVVIESIQWFFDDDMSADAYMANFSEKQFYEFLHNERISDKNKQYLCNRFLELNRKSKEYEIFDNRQLAELASKDCVKKVIKNYPYPQTYLLAKMYLGENPVYKILYQLTKPYYAVNHGLQVLKDKYNTYVELAAVEDDCTKTIASTDWETRLTEAEMQGAEACANNDLYVNDDYYTEYIEPVLSEISNDMTAQEIQSKEWEDYEFFLKVCDELEIKPYIINVSCNGWYYDYRGLDKEKRKSHYNRVADLANEYGIETYDGLIEKEYEPYVFVDAMHLGWKGWLYVSEAITDYYK